MKNFIIIKNNDNNFKLYEQKLKYIKICRVQGTLRTLEYIISIAKINT